MSTLRPRPDIAAATRGGDWTIGADGEGAPESADLGVAKYWRGIYLELVTMEESVLARIRELQALQSVVASIEVEHTNVPVVVAQVEKFRQRLGYWETRILQLGGLSA